MSVSPPTAGYPSPGSFPPRVRFAAIGDAWNQLTSDLGGWIVASLISLILIVVGYFILTLISIPLTLVTFGLGALVMVLVGTVPLMLLVAGLMRRALSQIRGLVLPATSIFDLGGRGKETALYAVYMTAVNVAAQVVTIIVGLLFTALLGPAGLALMFLVTIVVALIIAVIQSMLIFGIIMVVDQELSAKEAFTKALETFMPHKWSTWGMSIVWSICSELGAIACGVGVIFTFPLFAITPAVIYNDFFPEPQAAPDPTAPAAYPRPPQ